MVVPSINVKFSEGNSFRARVTPVPGLGYAITEFLKNWPDAGAVVCKDIRRMDFADGGRDYVVVFTRRRNQVGLMNIFEVPGESRRLAVYLEALLKDYCGGKP